MPRKEIRETDEAILEITWLKPEDDPTTYAAYCEAVKEMYETALEEMKKQRIAA